MTGSTTKAEFDGSQGKLASALEMPAGVPKAYALFAHCFSCSKDIKAAREVSRALRAEGFAVLRFDFTGLGSSEGDFANTNFSSNVDDLLKAADYLRQTYAAPSIIVGHSLGGAAAIVAAKHIPEIKGVVTINAPSDAGHVVKQLGDKRRQIEQDGEAEVQLAGRPFRIKKQFLDDLENQSVLDCAKVLKKPLLILHGPHDNTVGIENASDIFQAAKHPKSFVSLDDADHLLSRAKDARYAANIIAAWVARYVDDVAEAAKIKPYKDGAAAATIDGRALAVSVSMDGHSYVIDAGTEEGGDDLGPNPTRVVEGALAACSVMTMCLYANRKGWDVKSMRVMVKRAANQDSHAARVLEKTVEVEGDIDDKQLERIRQIAGKCPVHRMLTEEIAIISPND